MKPRPESPRGSARSSAINALRDIPLDPVAFALKVAFQFCNETARFGPLRSARVHGMHWIQDD